MTGFGLIHLILGKIGKNKGQLTITLPAWFGCITQEYGYSPGSVKVCSNSEFGASMPVKLLI